MSRRAAGWAAAIAVLGLIDLAATINAHLNWHGGPDAPAVLPLNQLLGWITSISLLIVAILIVIASINNARWMRPYTARVRRTRRGICGARTPGSVLVRSTCSRTSPSTTGACHSLGALARGSGHGMRAS